jgi:carbon storage regulator CsrA
MLIISRKKDQKIIVADEIEITILEVGRNRVRFGIKAPKHVPIQTRLKTTPEAEISNGPTTDPEETVMPAVVGFNRRN